MKLQTGLISMGYTSFSDIQDISLHYFASQLLLKVRSVDGWVITGTVAKQ